MCQLDLSPISGVSPRCYKVAVKKDGRYFSPATPAEYISEKPVIAQNNFVGNLIHVFERSILRVGSELYEPRMTGKTSAFQEIMPALIMQSTIKHHHPINEDKILEIVVLAVQFKEPYYSGKYIRSWEPTVKIFAGTTMIIGEEVK